MALAEHVWLTMAFCSLWCWILMDLSGHTHQVNIFSNLAALIALLHMMQGYCCFQRKSPILFEMLQGSFNPITWPGGVTGNSKLVLDMRMHVLILTVHLHGM